MTRCALSRAMDLRLGRMYVPKTSRHATYPKTSCVRKISCGVIESPCRIGLEASVVEVRLIQSWWCRYRKIRHSLGRILPAFADCGRLLRGPCRSSDSVAHPSGSVARDGSDDRERDHGVAPSHHPPTARR